jgi:hypothetical protein
VSKQLTDSPISWQPIVSLQSARSAHSSTSANSARSGCGATSQPELQGGRIVPLRKLHAKADDAGGNAKPALQTLTGSQAGS